MPNSDSRHPDFNPIRHTALFLSEGPDAEMPHTPREETVFGEDLVTVNRIFENVVDIGFDFLTARDRIVPIIAAGIRSERKYRRDSHRQLKALGHIAGRRLFGATEHALTDEQAAALLAEFAETAEKPSVPKIGLELGHIELAGSTLSVDAAWRKLDDLGERIADLSHLDKTDARHLPPSHRSAIWPGNDLRGNEVRLPRARTNVPVVDLGKKGLQQFVRVAVGYDSADRKNPLSFQEIRDAHHLYMEEHSTETGIIRLDERIFAYPIAGTLVTLNRNKAA